MMPGTPLTHILLPLGSLPFFLMALSQLCEGERVKLGA